MSKTVNRERWKADQARRKAAALAADFPDDAAALTFEADLADQHAAACERLNETRAALLAARDAGQLAWAQALLDHKGDGPRPQLADFLPGPDDDLVVAHKAASIDVRVMRQFWRELGEANGSRALGSVRNHVTDPNDDELAAWADEQKAG